MALRVDEERLSAFLEDFYVLTGIRVVLFDEDGNEILSHLPSGAPFCEIMRRCPEFLRRCRESDAEAFRRCRRTGEMTVYRCHAGLMEAVIPLRENGRIIGFLMFGQVGNRRSRADLTQDLRAVCARFAAEPPEDAIRQVAIREERQIRACVRILDACTGYIRLNELAVPGRAEQMTRLEDYIRSHLSEDLSVRTLCSVLAVSRASLYRLFPQGRGGVAEYIRRLRVGEARHLLKTTDLSTEQICARIGFSDPAYFRRVYRQVTGRSVSAERSGADT